MTRITRTLSIALLIADTPVPQVVAKRGDYHKIYTEWLNNSLAAVPRHHWQDEYKLNITPFDVVKDQKYPDEGMIKDGLFDAIMITGSCKCIVCDSNPKTSTHPPSPFLQLPLHTWTFPGQTSWWHL